MKKIWLILLFFCNVSGPCRKYRLAKLGWTEWCFKVNDAGLFPADQAYTLKVAWRKPLGAGYSPVSIRGDLAVTMFSDETFDYVIALNAENGADRWRYKIGPAYLGHYGSHLLQKNWGTN